MLQPFDPRPLFQQVRTSLLGLLAELVRSDWDLPTAAGHWRVRDIVAHLLGDDVSRLSRSRDHHQGPGPDLDEPLSQWLDGFNEQWVEACARVGNRVLHDLLFHTSGQVLSYWQQVNLDELGEPVSWVRPGEPAPVWLDCARDFTEDWVHQEQIRQAVGRQQSPDPIVLHAVLDTFMHAMSRTLDQGNFADGCSLVVRLEPEPDTAWTWSRQNDRWAAIDVVSQPTAELVSDAQTWWQLCVRMLTPAQAQARVRVIGDERLAGQALKIVSIIRDS